jgi:DNA-binding transcriptional ArsR family regulator
LTIFVIFTIIAIFTEQQIGEIMDSEPLGHEQPLIRQLIDTFNTLPDVHAELVASEVVLHVAGEPRTLSVVVRKDVFPRDVRQLIWPQGNARMALPLLAAETVSPGAKEQLKEKHIGYFDSGGSLYLPAPGAYFYVDKPPPKSLARRVQSLFSGRRAQVLHALLAQHQDWFGVTELAQRAQVSPSTVSQALAELEHMDWLDARGQGPGKERHLREPTALLDTWAKQIAAEAAPKLLRYYVPTHRDDALLRHVAEVFDSHSAPYAISHEAAAQHMAPFLSSVGQLRMRVLAGARANAALAELGAKPATAGANLAIIQVKTPGELLGRESIDGLWLASPLQIYLDLLRGEGRTPELAEHFRKEQIGF